MILGPIIAKQMENLKTVIKQLLIPFILLLLWQSICLSLYWDSLETDKCKSLWQATFCLSLATACSIIVNIILLNEEDLGLEGSVAWFGVIVASIILRTCMAIAVGGILVFIDFDAKCLTFYWNAMGWTATTLAAPWLAAVLFIEEGKDDREIDVEEGKDDREIDAEKGENDREIDVDISKTEEH